MAARPVKTYNVARPVVRHVLRLYVLRPCILSSPAAKAGRCGGRARSQIISGWSRVGDHMIGHRVSGGRGGGLAIASPLLAAVLASGLAPLAGCAKQTATLPRPPQPNPSPLVGQDVEKRVAE